MEAEMTAKTKELVLPLLRRKLWWAEADRNKATNATLEEKIALRREVDAIHAAIAEVEALNGTTS